MLVNLFLLFVTIMTTTLAATDSFRFPLTYTMVEDHADLPLLNPDLAHRETAKIRLANGLEMLLISDEGADQSAAVVSVGAGSWNDPEVYPGMAHFCEHMLFMGTEKYPDTNEFTAQVSDYDGHTNAFTAPDRTVYMFSSRLDGFLPLLDRFAHFFIDPTFNASNISREMHAVDQEFAMQKENDGWREYMVFKEMGNPNHPNHSFSTGNSQTLSNIPQSALKKWHRSHYGANRIRAAIYSSLPLEALKEAALKAFNDVPVIAPLSADFTQPLTSNEQRGHLVSIQSIHHRHTLILNWELPPHLSNDDSKSADLIAYALNRGQKFNLYEKLKNERLIDSLHLGVDDLGGKVHTFFKVEVELSQQGMDQIDTVIQRIFEALQGLRETGIPEFLHHEKNALAKLKYQYQSRINAFQYISWIGRTLFDEELSTFPKKSILSMEYNPRNFTDALSFLTPNNCMISILTPNTTSCDREEKWLKVPYAVQPLSSTSLQTWKEVQPNPDIRLAESNPYVPAQLDLVPPLALGSLPVCMADMNFGSAYYVRCEEYQTPQTSIRLHLLSPEITSSARSQVFISLYLDHLTDQLHPTLSAAASAGLSSTFRSERNRLHLEVFGFSEKAPLLFQEILRQMPQNPPTPEQFDLYVARHKKDYSNGAKEQPSKQAKELLLSLINQDRTTKKEKLAALHTISYTDFLTFYKKLFEKTYLETFFSGNLTLKTAEGAWLDALHALGKTPYPKTEHAQTKTLHLPDEEGPFALKQETETQGNAALLLLDVGDFTFERRAAQEVLSSALGEAFFDVLRTKQKTGYLAQSQDAEFERRLYQYFLVQSNTHQPEDLLHRFELFLEEYLQDFSENIPVERFETLKESAIFSLKTRYRNIKDKSDLWDKLTFNEKGDFSFIEKRVQGLSQLSYDQFTSLAQEFLSRSNRKRLAILLEGKLSAPFSYLPTTLSELNEVVHYSPRPEESHGESAQK